MNRFGIPLDIAKIINEDLNNLDQHGFLPTIESVADDLRKIGMRCLDGEIIKAQQIIDAISFE